MVILRRSIVWGRYSAWSTRLIKDLRAGHVAFIDAGRGAGNTTYVDNLIDAMLLGVENDAALNQVFLITDGERITGEISFAHTLPCWWSLPRLPEMTRAEIEASRGKKSGMVMGSVKAMARVARSKPFLRETCGKSL